MVNIRCSSHSIKFANKIKQKQYFQLLLDYEKLVKKYVNVIWNKQIQKKFLESQECNLVYSNRRNISRLKQCAAKQACVIVNSQLSKHNKRLYKLKQLQKEGKDTSCLQRKISLNLPKKPRLFNINVELDSRFFDIKRSNHFDEFIQLKEIGNKQKIKLPIKYTKVFNKWNKLGKRLKSIRLTKNNVIIFFQFEKQNKIEGKKVGLDQGCKTCVSLSDNQVTKKNKHGYDLDKIMKVLCKRKKGSKGYKRAQEHRKNYINWSINKLNFNNIKEVGYEKLNLKNGKGNYLSKFAYSLIEKKFISKSQEEGFKLTLQDNKFRSQRCSKCGWAYKLNRKGKTFKCKSIICNFITDSDLNAASNHEVDLYKVPNWVYNEKLNSKGFYWRSDGIYDINYERIIRSD